MPSTEKVGAEGGDDMAKRVHLPFLRLTHTKLGPRIRPMRVRHENNGSAARPSSADTLGPGQHTASTRNGAKPSADKVADRVSRVHVRTCCQR